MAKARENDENDVEKSIFFYMLIKFQNINPR
jgi:hypothetical protein